MLFLELGIHGTDGKQQVFSASAWIDRVRSASGVACAMPFLSVHVYACHPIFVPDSPRQVENLGIRPGQPLILDRKIERCVGPDTFSGSGGLQFGLQFDASPFLAHFSHISHAFLGAMPPPRTPCHVPFWSVFVSTVVDVCRLLRGNPMLCLLHLPFFSFFLFFFLGGPQGLP